MAFTFFRAQGKEIGKSLLEEEKLGLAKELLEKVKSSRIKFLLPVDIVAAEEFKNDSPSVIVNADDIPGNKIGLDIGPETIKLFSEEVLKSKTIVWNGPMGVFEMDKFSKGTFEIAEVLAGATRNGAITVVGGGDSAAAVGKAGLEKNITHVSTGGGASLEFLEGKILPGVAALSDAN
jgi:phosphoglycerate kinase